MSEIKFSGVNDLKGFSYFLNLSEIETKGRLNLANRIFDLGGRTTFDKENDSIHVIDNPLILKHRDYMNIFTKFTKIVFYDGSKLNILKCEKNKNPEKLLRIISASQLINILNKIEEKSDKKFYRYGLPSNIDLNGTLAIIIKGKLKYHTFECYRKTKVPLYDIPTLNLSVPQGFSIFTTQSEIKLVNDFIKRNPNNIPEQDQSQKQLLNGNNNVSNPQNLPLARKEHNYCHLCLVRYEDYLKHIQSKEHSDRHVASLHLFDDILKTLGIIRDYRKKMQVSKPEETDVPEIKLFTKEDFIIEQSTKKDTNFESEIKNQLDSRDNPTQINYSNKNKNYPFSLSNTIICNKSKIQANEKETVEIKQVSQENKENSDSINCKANNLIHPYLNDRKLLDLDLNEMETQLDIINTSGKKKYSFRKHKARLDTLADKYNQYKVYFKKLENFSIKYH